MKPLTKGGGLVDFKENIIFEEYKDKNLISSLEFKKEIKKKYKIIVSSDLYTKIINYQIKEYGGSLSYSQTTTRDFVENFIYKTPKYRSGCRKNWEKYKDEIAFIDRIEGRNENKRTKKI